MLSLRAAGQHHTIRGAIFSYGCFDLSLLPSARVPHPPTPFLGSEDAARFQAVYLPGMTLEECKSPLVSPAYNDLAGLGSALFIIGTEDVLIDDTILMYFPWGRAKGNLAEVKILPGAPHGFMIIDASVAECAAKGWAALVSYLNRRMEL